MIKKKKNSKNSKKKDFVGMSGGGEIIDRTKNRSDHYQNVICEAPCSPDMLTEVADADGIGAQLNPFGYNEELLELKELLKEAMWKIIKTGLTDRQSEIIGLYAKGYTQTEIAKALCINQSSVAKSLSGNCDYKNGKKVYGGAKKKIMKISEKDKSIQDILNRISEIEGSIF